MDEILFLSHRIPYPPDKGDKIRSWHVLRHLASRYRVHLGCLLDDPDDRAHLPFLAERVASLHVEEISPRRQKLLSLSGLLTGEPLTFAYFRKAGLRRWARRVIAERPLKFVYVFSSGVAPFALAGRGGPPVIVDFVDVDSEKWRQYAEEAKPPLSWLFAREARLLEREERRIAERAAFSTLVSEPEAALFRCKTGLDEAAVGAVGHRLDHVQFDTGRDWATPIPAGER
ncbi:MAG: glycosyltransferase, partial [Tistlia sp.]